MIIEQQTRTVFVGAIQYMEYPPPESLIRVMKQQWAEELIRKGSLRLHKLEFYRRWEKGQLGDPDDGKGLYRMGGHPMHSNSSNDIYVWCLSLPTIQRERLMLLAKDGGYDSVIVLHSPEKFFKRVHGSVSKYRKHFPLHCGLVRYNRGEEVNKEILNSQKFNFNVFQKDHRFKEDMEYRMSIINATFDRLKEDYLDLLIGDCSDIISMEAL